MSKPLRMEVANEGLRSKALQGCTFKKHLPLLVIFHSIKKRTERFMGTESGSSWRIRVPQAQCDARGIFRLLNQLIRDGFLTGWRCFWRLTGWCRKHFSLVSYPLIHHELSTMHFIYLKRGHRNSTAIMITWLDRNLTPHSTAMKIHIM